MRHIPQNIAFELSNRCNYSAMHPKCPNKAGAELVYLDANIVTRAVDYIASVGWDMSIFFNIYNEPLLDPRLFWFMQYVQDHSNCRICIFTNGWNLTPALHSEIVKFRAGVTISVYSDAEEKRLSCAGMNTSRIELDSRMDIYNNAPVHSGKCFFPSTYPMITHQGILTLCCLDTNYNYPIADLNKVSFQEAIESEYRMLICDELSSGVRTLDACKRCSCRGWGVTDET